MGISHYWLVERDGAIEQANSTLLGVLSRSWTSTSDGDSESGLINCVTSTGSSVEESSTLEIACANPSRLIGANLSVALHTLGAKLQARYEVRQDPRREPSQPQTAETKREPGNGNCKFRARSKGLLTLILNNVGR